MEQTPHPSRTAVYTVAASACPQLLCRILGFVARLGRVADRVEAVRKGKDMRISVELSDIDTRCAELLAENMRALITVEAVHLTLT